MHTRILLQMREKIRRRQYVMTSHARKEMTDDGFTIYDVESGILSGEIIQRQKDQSTAEWKYRIRGTTISDNDIESICKISPTGKLVIITVYEP